MGNRMKGDSEREGVVGAEAKNHYGKITIKDYERTHTYLFPCEYEQRKSDWKALFVGNGY